MANRFARLPMRGLIVFEAAARHGKFAGAAAELQMTQARVSQHIAELEAMLSLPLFHRRYRGVDLTGPGADLLGAVRQGLQIVANGFDAAERLRSSQSLTVLTDFGFAAWWLMPRIEALRAAVPQAEIRLTTLQSGSDVTTLDYDFGVLFGEPTWQGCRTRLIHAEEVYPVCAPGLSRAASDPLAPACCLLDLRPSGDQHWFRWADWFRAMGKAPPPAHRFVSFNNYQMVLQAVLAGQGVALGWAPLIDDLVRDGRLVRLAREPMVSSRGYFLIEPARRHANPLAERAIDWLFAHLRPSA